jgi:hypothetical protein
MEIFYPILGMMEENDFKYYCPKAKPILVAGGSSVVSAVSDLQSETSEQRICNPQFLMR